MGRSDAHRSALAAALGQLDTAVLERWAQQLTRVFAVHSRLLVAGNGGSAALAQHLTAELVGRFNNDRRPLPALALHVDTSTVTAVSNDFGYREVFARQVLAYGRPGDVLLLISASGRSDNLLAARRAAAEAGLTAWALTGSAPNPLADGCDDALAVEAGSVATVQECHLCAIHILCGLVDDRTGPDRGGEGGRSLVIVGDTSLDRDVTGDARRLSPEAPVPIVVLAAPAAVRPGGAGLAALMAAREPGWSTLLITALGGDAGRVAGDLLRGQDIEIIDIGVGGSTPEKARIRASGQTLLRVDEQNTPVVLGDLPSRALAALAAADAVLVCDYGGGVTAHPPVRAALAQAADGRPVVWDPHPRGAPPVRQVALAVPNSAEADIAADGIAGDGLAPDIQRARLLLQAWPVTQVAVTRGAEGAVLVGRNSGSPLAVPVAQVAHGDACGAGDQFAVAAATALGAGRSPAEAVAAAVEAASRYVEDGGPAGLSEPARSQPSGREEAVAVAERVRARGGRVVAAGGCFDLLHAGHIMLLQQARGLGDALIVCLNSDASVTRLKGQSRPLVPQAERRAVLQALSGVDAVVLFDEDTPAEVLRLLRPDTFVKGGQYAEQEIPETAVLREWGGEVVLVPHLRGMSTTALIGEAVRRNAALRAVPSPYSAGDPEPQDRH